MNTKSKKSVAEIVTQTIIEQLEKGTVPWRKPWKHVYNAVSGKAYRGFNQMLLGMLEYGDPRFLTFKQAKDLGGSVSKGSKGHSVVYWNFLQDKDNPDKTIPLLRFYTVFNVEQCEGLTKLKSLELAKGESLTAETIIQNMPDRPKMTAEGDSAYYRPSTDTVNVPKLERFESLERYYATVFHELMHSTGHAKRLNRKEVTGIAQFGSEVYSKEELTAEIGSAMLCSKAELQNKDTLDQSSAYIQSWLQALRDDKSMLISASSKAQKGYDWILGLREEVEVPE